MKLGLRPRALSSQPQELAPSGTALCFHFHVCMDAGAHGTRRRVAAQGGCRTLSSLFYLTQQGTTLSLNPEPVDMAGLSGRVLRGSPVSAFRGWNHKQAATPIWHLLWLWEADLQSFCLHSKYFDHGAISSAPGQTTFRVFI